MDDEPLSTEVLLGLIGRPVRFFGPSPSDPGMVLTVASVDERAVGLSAGDGRTLLVPRWALCRYEDGPGI